MPLALTKILLTLSIILGYGKANAESRCPKITWFQLKKDLDSRFPKNTQLKLVFFSPWCGACKQHLKQDSTGLTIFINTFDEEQRAEAIMKTFGISNLCYSDADLSQVFNVRSLPSLRDIRL